MQVCCSLRAWGVAVGLVCGAVMLAGCAGGDGEVDASRVARAAPAAPVAPPAPDPQTHRVTQRPRIVILGDSLTAGYGLSRHQSIPALLQARLDAGGYGFEVVNAGVSGDTSAGGLSRLDWSLDGDVRLLVLELGANDGLRGLPVASLKANLDQIIRRAKARGITVLLTGMEAPPNYGAAYTAEFRATYRELAAAHKVAFMPFFLDGVAGVHALNLADGIHPNPKGARIVEEALWRALQPLLPPAR